MSCMMLFVHAPSYQPQRLPSSSSTYTRHAPAAPPSAQYRRRSASQPRDLRSADPAEAHPL